VILLDLHAAASPVALLAADELLVDVSGKKGQAGRTALENRNESRTMGFAGSNKAYH
jgi:hypothetical protein